MNVAARLMRQSLMRHRAVSPLNRISRIQQRNSSSKLMYPHGKFNIIQRKGHGFVNYIQQWECLYFSDNHYRSATVFVWGPSLFAVGVMFYAIWNSAWRDPEARLRPHKKAWHLDHDRVHGRGELYRGGNFWWYPLRNNPKRVEFLQARVRNGCDEPGQIGWEELPIPSLDEEDEE
mmetsp:Transcript_122/g.180  ORF Transcript_122/g.180 Transcript_122/m.180 type:complete len:176 (-) Transcript_122:230-757(-)|eukprot:CAMPEP_0202690430 /NCGR_PEP_ID=MMETSP1385-20130828/5416_1 /ASSEMBLY_ACC=CAM_ASM_000861 /TAXON_ID=933848 /ORGANISM="Elphidium margaritaceum" /LENGTH=175 /DNA_ID=CAMNT_0049345693 /DNA_START=98 /DNA_END=625 /DNA_ORIENTATION=-